MNWLRSTQKTMRKVVPHAKKTTMIQMRYIGLICLLIICSSCEKWFKNNDDKFVVCNSNCAELNAKGSIIDLTKNAGISGIPITLRWTKSQCYFCPENKIDVRSTNSNGIFSFNNSIDTSFFSKGYVLSFNVPENSQYIITSPSDKSLSIDNLNDNSLDNLKFNYYRKAKLQIKIERVEEDTFEMFIVEHYFQNNYGYVDCVITPIGKNQYNYPLNDTYNTKTASDLKTYIKWTKSINSTNYVKIDSLICTKDKMSTYIIKY